VDVAVLSLGSTLGLRHADEALAGLIEEAGRSCRIVAVRVGAAGRLRRQITLTDLIEGIAARRAARGLRGARAVIVSSATTALLIEPPDVPWAIRFDSPTLLNRPGPAGVWQRARERKVFPRADVWLPWGDAAARAAAPLVDRAEAAAPRGARGVGAARAPDRPAVIPLRVPIDVPPAGTDRADEVVTYAGWMDKRGIDVLLEAWRAVAPDGVRLVIGGADPDTGRRWLARRGIEEPPGVEWAGVLARDEWLHRVGRARAYVNASRREDHGIGPLEALALGTPLVTVPSAGAYEALPIARALAPTLVASEVSASALTVALRTGLALDPTSDYAQRARAALAPYRREAVLTVVQDRVLPALGLSSA
jgi:glycosyltransferase involved in cell wall biosynthesis